MLLQRVITALILLPLVLAAIWFLAPPWLYLVFSGAGLIGAWEWTGMMGLPQQGPGAGRRWLYLGLTALALAGAWALHGCWPWLAAASVAWWLFALFLIPGFPGNLQRKRPGVAALGVLGLVLLLSGWHGWMKLQVRRFAAGQNRIAERRWRLLNEVPALFLIAVVILVIVRPF